MTKNDARKKRIWSFVQDGMDSDERADMEKSMDKDEALSADVEKAKLADKYYMTLLPRMDLEPAELEQTILKLWEQSEEHLEWKRRHEAERERTWVAASPSEPRRSVAFRPWMALAACLLILVGVHRLTLPHSLLWMEPELAELKYREGKVPSIPPSFRSEDLARFSNRVVTAIEDAYAENREQPFWSSWFTRSSEWTLHLRMHELHGGLLKVEVDAVDQRGEGELRYEFKQSDDVDREEPRIIHTWSEMFESKEAVEREIEGFAYRVGFELAQKR